MCWGKFQSDTMSADLNFLRRAKFLVEPSLTTGPMYSDRATIFQRLVSILSLDLTVLAVAPVSPMAKWSKDVTTVEHTFPWIGLEEFSKFQVTIMFSGIAHAVRR